MKSLIQFAKDIHLLHTWSKWVHHSDFKVYYRGDSPDNTLRQGIVQRRNCIVCNKQQFKKIKA